MGVRLAYTRIEPGDAMKRSFIVTIAIALGLIVGCGSGTESGASRPPAVIPPPEQLILPGTLTIAADFQGPPFDYYEGTEPRGFDVEFDRAVADLMGLKVKLVDGRFASLVTGLEAGRYDAVISVLYITAERAKKIDLVPYAQTGSGFLVKKNGAFQPRRPEDLCGHTVAVLAGGFEEQLITTGELGKQCRDTSKPLKAKSFPSDVEATRDVADGRSEAFFSNHSIVLHRAKQVASFGLTTSNASPLYPVPAGIGVRKDRPDVRRAFESAVEHLHKSGELKKLLDKYGLEPPDPELVQKALAGNT
ncbi:ABC transporter substrate-binding protein [Nonomuraea deserti]|nr:ABC transporter substrate-binding protein [Nonomuraea deserti]